MANRNLLDTPFTPREQVYGGLVAASLWVFSLTLLAWLAVWSLKTPWAA